MIDYNFKSQAARDAHRMGYGNENYWFYLDLHAQEMHDHFAAKGDMETANKMLTESLSEALMGNEGV